MLDLKHLQWQVATKIIQRKVFLQSKTNGEPFPVLLSSCCRPVVEAVVAMVPIHLTDYLQLSLFEGKGITF